MITDGDWTLINWDAEMKRSTWALHDTYGNTTTIRTDYQVDGLIDQNAEVRNIAEKQWRGDYHRIASIPLNVLWDSGLMDAQNQGDDKWLSKWLNDGDNRAWRTKEGQV